METTDANALLRTLSALLGEAPEVAESFLLAAIYVRALRTEESPRNVVEALFKALPSSAAWPAIRDALVAAVEGDPG